MIPNSFKLVFAYIGVVALVWAVIGVLYLRNRDGKVAQALDAWSSKPHVKTYWDKQSEVTSRLPLFGALVMMLMIQIVIAGYALPEDAARDLNSLFSVAGFDLGGFTVILILLCYWAAAPKLKYFLARIGSILGVYDPDWSDDPDSEAAD